MKIKKIVLSSLVALLSFTLAMPALATNENGDSQNGNSSKQVSVAYQPHAVTVRGDVVSISDSVLPLDITIKLEKITPTKLKNYPGTFPMKGNVVVVHLTKDTKIVRKYLGKASFTELTVGDKVSITGKLQGDGTVNTNMIKDESIKVDFYAKKGAVTAVDIAGNTFIIKNNNKEFKVFVTANTKFSRAGFAKSTLADLKVGDDTVVRGVIRQSTNEITADSIVIKIGEKEKLFNQLEAKKIFLEKKMEVVKNNLTKMQAELDALLKKLVETTAVVPVIEPAVVK